MRIAVTGASGNLGTALLRRLAPTGDDELVGVVRRVPPPEPPYDQVTWHEVDLTSRDAAAALDQAFSGADAVVHLAWGFQPARDVRYLERLGVGGTREVLAAAVRADVAHLVHLSSVGAYAPAPGTRVDESWRTTGIPTLAYSRHKVTVERMLDVHDARGAAPLVTRMRPGFVLQHDAGSGLARYGLPSWLPSSVVGLLPVLPLDRRFVIPVVHSDDVADALARVLHRRVGGAFNLSAEPPVTRDDVAAALGARPVHVPSHVLGAALRVAWHARLQPLDPGWLDLGFSVPLLDTARAREELGWEPRTDARTALRQVVEGIGQGAGTPSPVLRPRSFASAVVTAVRRGPTSRRRLP